MLKEPWLAWAVEIQSIAQAGLAYTEGTFDKERYSRLREIAAEMISCKTQIPADKVNLLFCSEKGYQTPKLVTRAAVFEGDRILLVHEKDGNWSLPGGWVDVQQSIESNTVKEVKEEAGLDVAARKIIAIQDRKKHNEGTSPFGVCKIFVLCENLGGSFSNNSETTESGYFSIENLPPLAEEKCSRQQIELCFQAKDDEHWITQFD